ncbi:Hypothetical protein GLP15_3139 [Giardia lamblia P15]|uniref:Uncharacterized protein n=1 Tax=Giardia intestinalis (strain P15) TaxID=658858 RepID=E1EVR5_GIAIA|nr:Hypothetical protein GLP15_3139 [Giardia lamblia P15]
MALREPPRASRAPLMDGNGYAYGYSYASTSKPSTGVRQSGPSALYSNVAKETRDRIKRYDEQTKQLEEQEHQRMQQYKISHAKQAAEKRKVSRLPAPSAEFKPSTRVPDSHLSTNETTEHTGTMFTSILHNVCQEVAKGKLQSTAFMDSCVPFLHSEAQGAKTFVLEENRAISETHQLAMCSVQNKLPPSKIKGGPTDPRSDKRHASEFSVASTDTSITNLSQAKVKTTAPVVPPEDEYFTSINSNSAAGLQRAIDDVRQLPTYAESSDDEDDKNYTDGTHDNGLQQYSQVARPALASSIQLEPNLGDDQAHTHMPFSASVHEQLANGIMRLSPIPQNKEVELKMRSAPKPKSKSQVPPKGLEGLETVKLNRNLAKCTDDEEALKRELSELDKKLANYSIDSTNISHQTGISISILSDYPPKRPSKTLEDLAYGLPDDDLTDEQRQKKRLDYLKHQQMHDSKAVKESLSNAAVGQHQFRIQNIDQLKTQQPDRRQPSASNKAQYSAIAPLSNSTSNTSVSNSNGRGKSAQATYPMRRVMRRTSAKQSLSEPKPLPAVLASSGCADDSSALQEVHVSNHQLLKSLFSGPLDASQGVGYGVLNAVKTKSRGETYKSTLPEQKGPDLKAQVHTNNHSYHSENDDEDSEVRIAVVNYQEHYNRRSAGRSAKHQSQQDRRGPRSNMQSDSEQHGDDCASNTDKNPVKSVVRNPSGELRPSVSSRNGEKTHPSQVPSSSEHRASAHKLARRTTPAITPKNQVRQKSVTFTDEREYNEDIEDERENEKATTPYSYQYAGHRAQCKEVEALDNEFIPKYDNLTVSDLLDDDCDALDDYDFSA